MRYVRGGVEVQQGFVCVLKCWLLPCCMHAGTVSSKSACPQTVTRPTWSCGCPHACWSCGCQDSCWSCKCQRAPVANCDYGPVRLLLNVKDALLTHTASPCSRVREDWLRLYQGGWQARRWRRVCCCYRARVGGAGTAGAATSCGRERWCCGSSIGDGMVCRGSDLNRF